MADALDILEVDRMDGPELTKDHFLGGLSNQKKSNKVPAAKRPEGMSREVFALLHRDGAQISSPLTPTDTPAGYHRAKARLGLKKVRPWIWTPFVHPGRSDDAVLYHWRRACDTDHEYPFAKFSKKLVVDTFTEDEYFKYIHDAKINWSYAETEFLFDLCGMFEVRFIVVQDRYNASKKFAPRTVEEIKERYYEVVNKLHKVRNAGSDSIPDEKPPSEGPKVTVVEPVVNGNSEATNNGETSGAVFKNYGVGFVYDSQTEYRRKFQINRLLARTQEEIDEEQYVSCEFKKILARKREAKKKAKESAIAASRSAVAASSIGALAGKPPQKRKALTHPVIRKIEHVEPTTPKEATGEPKKIKLLFPGKTKCYSALSRILVQATDSSEGRRMKLRLAQVDQHLTSMLGVPHLTIGSEELCDKYNSLRSSFAGLYELGTSLSAARKELKALVEAYELRKPEGHEDLGIPSDLLPTVAPEAPSSGSSLGNLSPVASVVEVKVEDGAERAQRSISEMIQLEGVAGAPTRKRKAALEQCNVLKKLKTRP